MTAGFRSRRGRGIGSPTQYGRHLSQSHLQPDGIAPMLAACSGQARHHRHKAGNHPHDLGRVLGRLGRGGMVAGCGKPAAALDLHCQILS